MPIISFKTWTWSGVALLAFLAGFAMIAWRVSQPGIPLIDTATTAFLHDRASPALDVLMATATALGSSPVLAAVVALAALLLVVRRQPVEGTLVVVAFAGSIVLNDALKAWVQRPRPGFDWAGAWSGASFPSGHSMNSFVVYVAIALVVWRLAGRGAGVAAAAAAFVLVAVVGVSRIYLGVHWVSDVAGGYLAGAMWLLALATVWTGWSGARARTRRRQTPPA